MKVFKIISFLTVALCMHGMQQPAHIKGAPTQELPTLIQQTIRKLINSASSPELAIRHMQVILQNNKSLDPQLTDFIIKQLAQKFTPDNDIFFTALMLGTDSAIDWLITHYAQTNDKIKGLIFVALQAQIPQVVFKLIDRFPQLAQEEFEYQNPLGQKETSTFMIEAIAKEDIPLIKKLLSVGFDPNKKREGVTPYLLWIMDKNNLDLVKLFLDAGANPNLSDDNGVTPLMRAISHGDVSAVKLLLAYGADKDLKNKWGKDALSIAQEEKAKTQSLPVGIRAEGTRTMLDRYNKIIMLLQGSKKKIAYWKNYPKKRNHQIA